MDRARPDRAWVVQLVLGLLFGFALLWWMFALFFYAVVAAAIVVPLVAKRMRYGAAFGGGVLVGLGALMVFFTLDSARRCAEFDRQPNAGCQAFGVEQNVAVMSVLIVIGIGLIIASARRAGGPAASQTLGKRSVRGGE